MFRDQIEAVDEVLGKALLETMAVDFSMEGDEEASAKQRSKRAEWAIKALRIQTLKNAAGKSGAPGVFPPGRPSDRITAFSRNHSRNM